MTFHLLKPRFFFLFWYFSQIEFLEMEEKKKKQQARSWSRVAFQTENVTSTFLMLSSLDFLNSLWKSHTDTQCCQYSKYH